MTLDLELNSVEFKLGDQENEDTLRSASCKKLGLFSKFMLRGLDTLPSYWSKNCRIDCFKSEFIICPEMHKDHAFGTTAYLFYANDVLEGITFQVFGSRMPAEGCFCHFLKLANNLIGMPASQDRFTPSCHIECSQIRRN